MTAMTSRGVRCGNCGNYHPSASDVRACYQGLYNDLGHDQHIADHVAKGTITPERGAQLTGNRPGTRHQMNAQIHAHAERLWAGNNTANSPMGYGPQATEAQFTFITSLREQRGFVTVQDACKAAGINLPGDRPISKREAMKLIDWLKQQPTKTGNKVMGVKLPNVPAGHYAIPSLTGHNDLDFFRVDRPQDGRHKGKTFVKRVVGGHPDLPLRWQQYPQVLQAILDAGTEAAAKRYGQEVGRCYRCNRHLTDETSRALGIGPDCRNM